MMHNSTLFMVLALLGGILVISVIPVIIYFVFGLLLVAWEKCWYWVGRQMFYRFGGEADEQGNGRLPRAPYDRLYVECRWIGRQARVVQKKLGYVDWVDPGERPNLERLYELREEREG